jgi:hypothetical protein
MSDGRIFLPEANTDKERSPDAIVPADPESPLLAMEGIAIAMRPQMIERERYVSEMISRMVGRLFRYSFAACLGDKNASLAAKAEELKAKAATMEDAALSEDDRLTEIALRETGDILQFKREVYAVRNEGVENATPSDKLDNAVEELKTLRQALGYAA